MLEQILRLCEEHSLQKPCCYQGEYNVMTRGMETKLLPLLRAHGMTYNAFRYVFSVSLLTRLCISAKSEIKAYLEWPDHLP